jgi:hypothetical protein
MHELGAFRYLARDGRAPGKCGADVTIAVHSWPRAVADGIWSQSAQHLILFV